MRTLLFILLATPCFAGGPKYEHSPANLDDEIRNLYHDIKSVTLGDVRISSVTISTLTVSSIRGPFTNWTSYTPTFTGGWGTVTNISAYYRRVGDTLEAHGAFQLGTRSAANGKISLPSGLTTDTAKFPASIRHAVGQIFPMDTTGTPTTILSSNFGFLMADGSNTDGVFLTYQTQSGQFVANNVNALFTADNAYAVFDFKVPVTGWTF